VGLWDSVLHYVSAHGLHSSVASTSLKQHRNVEKNDNAAYDKEYDGLVSLPT
jgi:hypothetical protein